MNATRVLCVDDEPQVIEGLALQLRRGYEVVAAHSGAEGLTILGERGPFAVVLSDMQMPGMDGAAFLQRVREEAPDTTRILLTGHADIESAIAAVNHGQIFRFLTKPCPPNDLRLAFEAASAQYRLVTAEKVLLEQTLLGCIQAFTDILAITSPLVFGRSTRIQRFAIALCRCAPAAKRWLVEAAAMLSQLGYVAVPDEVARKQQSGDSLSHQEQAMVKQADSLTGAILARIPRLEPVQQVLAVCAGTLDKASNAAREIATEAAILRLATDFDALESQGMSLQDAVRTLRSRGSVYPTELLDQLADAWYTSLSSQEVHEVGLEDLRAGMVLASDVHMNNEVLLVARGFTVTAGFIQRVRNFTGKVKEPLLVFMPPEAPH